MSILEKDFVNVVISQEVEVTGGSSGSRSVKSTTVSVRGNISGAIPVFDDYPAEAKNIQVRGIRICTQAEVDSLKQFLFGGLAEPEKSTKLYQLLYQNHGTPLRVINTSLHYIAAWYGNLGLGFYYFVGYNPTSGYPTQSIQSDAIAKVY